MIRRCPNCKGGLNTQQTPHGVIYACQRCQGRAVALSVLRKAGADRELLKGLWLNARAGTKSVAVRPCPHCNHSMTLVYAPIAEAPVPLDVCALCQVVWFDPQEYEALPKSAAAAKRAHAERQAHILESKPMQPIPASFSTSAENRPAEAWKWLVGFLGMPVELNEPDKRKLPVLTWALLAACTLVMVLTYSDLSSAVMQWGFIPGQWSRHGGLTLLTSFFLHGGIMHLLSNMYFLLVFGDNVEEHIGWALYVPLLLGAHLAGVALHATVDATSTLPLVGASAGISGVIAYYAVVYPKARLGFLFWWYRFFMRWLVIPAWGALILYALLQTFGAAMQFHGFSAVSYLGHLGGLAVGVVAGFAARRVRSARPPSFAREKSSDAYRSSREHSYQK